jgi:soluble lytic murein transglycosylase-like protein
MAIIPVAIVLLYLLIGGNETPKDVRDSAPSVSQSTQSSTSPTPRKSNDYGESLQQFEADFDVIYTYITDRYTTVEYEEARRIAQAIVDYSRTYSVDPKLIAALIARESGFNRYAVSATSARGLGQIKDFNYEALGITDPFDIRQNVSGTVAYFTQMRKNWAGHAEVNTMALASYYQGYSSVRASRRLARKTRAYVRDILREYTYLKRQLA